MAARETTIADLQSKHDALQAKNESLEHKIEALAAALKASSPVQRITDIPSGVVQDGRIHEFLEGESRPFVLYAEHRGFQLVLRYGRYMGVNEATGTNMRDDDLIVRFVPFNGAGSEIPDSDDQRKRKFNWGILHVESIPEVVSGKYSAADVIEMIAATNAYKVGTIFDDSEARARLQVEYDILRARAGEEVRRQKMRSARPAGAHKGGGMAVSVDKLSDMLE